MREMKRVEAGLSLICCLHLAILTLCLSLGFALLFPGERITVCLLWAFGAVIPVQLIHWICLRIKKTSLRYLLCAIVTLAAVLIPDNGFRRLYYGVCCVPILIAGLWLARPKGRLVLTVPKIYHPVFGMLLYVFARVINAPLLPGFAIVFTALLTLSYCFFRNQEQVLRTLASVEQTELSPRGIVAVNRRVTLLFALIEVLILAAVPWLLSRERTPSPTPEMTLEAQEAAAETRPPESREIPQETRVLTEEGEPIHLFSDQAVVLAVVSAVAVALAMVVSVLVSQLKGISGSNGKHSQPERDWAMERLEHTVKLRRKKADEPLSGYEKKLRRRYEKLIRSRAPADASLSPMTPTELEAAAGMVGSAARSIHDLYSRTRYSQAPVTREHYAAFKEAAQRLPNVSPAEREDED